MRHRYDEHWRETFTLRDGQQVTLRLVRPADKPLFQEGLRHLSPRSRWRRFFSDKGELTARELAYLTEVDGEDHLALGAVRKRDSHEEGVGVARFIRLSGEPEVAEPAVVIVDELQGKGLGRALLRRLVEAAQERGVTRFRAEVLADNAPMLALLRELAPDAVEREEEPGVLLVELPLPPRHEGPIDHLLEQLLALAAKGGLCVRPRH